MGYAMNHGGNPYGLLPPVAGLSFANVFSIQNTPTIAYLPFWPLITGLVYAVYSFLGFGNRFAYYFLLKQPVIVGDVGLAYLLYSYVAAKKPNRSSWVLLFWLLSPFTVIISGIWGMFDSLAMAFMMISVSSTAYLKRGFWAGISIFAKSLPIIYAVPTTLRRARVSFALAVAIGLPVLFSAATFLIMRWPISTINGALVSSTRAGGDSMSIWDSLFYLTYLGVLPPTMPNVYPILGFLWIPGVIIFTFIAFKRFGFETDYGLIQSLLIITLGFLIFRARVTEQYAIYLLALSAIDVAVWNPKRKQMLMMTMAVALIYLVSHNTLLIPFLSPLYPNLTTQIASSLAQQTEAIRFAVSFLSGSMFTYLNVRYLIAALKR